MVGRRHHPIYGSISPSGYLSDTYMTHETIFGHIYMYRDRVDDPDWLPTSREIVLRIAGRYREWKAFG